MNPFQPAFRPAAAVTTNTTTAGVIADILGISRIVLGLSSGAYTAGGVTIKVQVFHSVDSGMAGETQLGSDLDVTALWAANTAFYLLVDLSGSKRYVRAKLVTSGGSGSSVLWTGEFTRGNGFPPDLAIAGFINPS